jgi:hypothetical protein
VQINHDSKSWIDYEHDETEESVLLSDADESDDWLWLLELELNEVELSDSLLRRLFEAMLSLAVEAEFVGRNM